MASGGKTEFIDFSLKGSSEWFTFCDVIINLNKKPNFNRLTEIFFFDLGQESQKSLIFTLIDLIIVLCIN